MKVWESYIKSFRMYLKLERGLSNHTIEAYIRDVHKLAESEAISSEGIAPTNVEHKHIESFVHFIFSCGLDQKSQARILSGLRAFFKFLILEDVIETNPLDNIEGPKLAKKIPSVLTVEEIMSIIAAIDMSDDLGHRNRAIVETLYACGLRVSELINLKLSAYFPEAGIIRVIGKNNKERLVPIGGDAMKHVNLYISEIRKKGPISEGSEDFVFLNRRGNPLTRVMIFTIIKNLKTKAGIEKAVSPHTFRHSFATHLIEGGANLRAIQDMLGHESITTTEMYTHMDTKFLRDTIMNFHPRNTTNT